MKIDNPTFEITPPRFRLFPRRPLSKWALFAALLIYFAICVYMYFAYVAPWINGEVYIRFGADSDSYWELTKGVQKYGLPHGFVGFGTNLLGPISIGLLFRNGIGVLCFDIFLFLISLKIAFSIPGIRKSMFGLLMLLNIELLPALTTLNKEILALFAAVLTAKYIYSEHRSIFLFLAVSIVSLFARWEQTAIFWMFLFFYRMKRPYQILILMILVITISYPIAIRLLPAALSGFTAAGEGGGTITILDNIQARGGFPLVMFPKMLMSSIGMLGSPWFYLSDRFHQVNYDYQEVYFQPLGCGAFIVVLIWAFFKEKLNVRRPIAFLVALQMLVIAVNPSVQPRYLYSVYILLCLELCLPDVGQAGDLGSPAHYDAAT